jgi:hypothetical protein
VVPRFRSITIGWLLVASLALGGLSRPSIVAGGEVDDVATPTAYLDGKAIPLAEVSRYYCDDFSFPIIRCSTSQSVAQTRATLNTLLATVDYVTIYEYAYYSGAWMNVSQDYSALALIGWNDKVSAFKVRNSETGRFFVDWFYGGSGWSFCCNTQQPTLGGYDNTFSSIQRT